MIPQALALESLVFVMGSVIAFDWIVSRKRRVVRMMKIVCRRGGAVGPVTCLPLVMRAPACSVPQKNARRAI